MSMVSMKNKCPYLDAVWVRVYQCWITVLQMWGLVRKTNPSFRWREGPIFKHINGLGTKENLVMSPDGARNQEQLCWREPAAIYCYALSLHLLAKLIISCYITL
jgi:hypothetical protein